MQATPHNKSHARLGSLHSTLLPLLTPSTISPPQPPPPPPRRPAARSAQQGRPPPRIDLPIRAGGSAAGSAGEPATLETEEEGSGSAVVDPPVLSPEMDSSVEKQGSGEMDPDERPPPAASGEAKACTECHTTKTPLWRGGPHGPMSLCNACGIRYRKKRREAMGLDSSSKAAAGGNGNGNGNEQQQRKKKATAAAAAAAASKRERERQKEADKVTLELRAVGFGKEVVLKQQRRRRMPRRRRIGEEERAALLLISLSSGIVYA